MACFKNVQSDSRIFHETNVCSVNKIVSIGVQRNPIAYPRGFPFAPFSALVAALFIFIFTFPRRVRAKIELRKKRGRARPTCQLIAVKIKPSRTKGEGNRRESAGNPYIQKAIITF